MPSLWRWRLGGDVTPDRRDVHRLLSRWLDTDHHAARKPWSWTTLRLNSGERVIEIGLVDDTLVEALVGNADTWRRSRRARADLPMPEPLQQISAANWSQLRASTSTCEWTVEFASPVTFRRGNQFLPWPAPSAVFGSLRAAWRTFAAPHIGDITLDLSLDPIIVTALDGASQTERVVLHERPNATGARDAVEVTVGGFVGRLRYAAHDPTNAAAANSLIKLAPFAGVGAYTTRGFGAVRIPGPTAPASHE